MRVRREMWGQPSLTLFSGITSLFHTCSTLTEHLLYARHCPGHWGHQNEEHPALAYWGHRPRLCSVDASSHWFIQHMILLSTSIGHPGGGRQNSWDSVQMQRGSGEAI